MGYDVGCGGAFGLLLSDDYNGPNVGKLYAEFIAKVEEAVAGCGDASDYDEARDEVAIEYIEKFRAAFAEAGIIVPPEAALYHTGVESDRPGRCSTPADDWVIGFPMFMSPFRYPRADESFMQAADWHTWVWGG